MTRGRLTRWLLALSAAATLPAQADIKVTIEGVEKEMRSNVLTYLSVERYSDRKDVDQDMMQRLYDRIDGEVKEALHPFGYYEPAVAAEFRAEGKDWQVAIAIRPGEPVRVRELRVEVEGPGRDDPVFDNVKNQDLLRVGSLLNHGAYAKIKDSLELAALSNGYLAERLVNPEMRVDPDSYAASVNLVLDTGPRYRFGKIDIQQDAIRPGLMDRFLRFREGDPYVDDEVRNTQYALEDSLFFSDVEVNVDVNEADADTLTVPVHITAGRSRPTFSIGGGYGTDTRLRGTLAWTDSRVNDRGHRFRAEIKASTNTRQITSRYDVPIGDPALERMSLEYKNTYEPKGDLNTNTNTLLPSVTRVFGRWQTVNSVAITRTTTTGAAASKLTSTLLVPGIVIASVPKGFLGEELFSRTLYAEVLGSHHGLGSDANFLRLMLQSERDFDLNYRWHLLLRGEVGTTLVDDFSEVPGIYRFFAGGDRSVRGFGYEKLSPKDADGNNIGGKHLLVGSVEVVRDIPWNLAVATFVDFGNAFDNFKDPREYSVGVGLRYRAPGVSIGIDFAKPLSEPHSAIRLHLNIAPKL
jgi:translocation and assembly module TamA